jgi:hypothetical protein
MLSSSFWYQGRISLKAFPNSSLLKGLEKKKWKKKMMEKKVEKEDDGKQSRHSPALPY